MNLSRLKNLSSIPISSRLRPIRLFITSTATLYRNRSVLTEDDYLSFLANIARNPKLLPGPIQRAFGSLHLSLHRLSIG